MELLSLLDILVNRPLGYLDRRLMRNSVYQKLLERRRKRRHPQFISNQPPALAVPLSEILLSTYSPTDHIPSFVCQSSHFETLWYRHWAQRIGYGQPDFNRFHDDFVGSVQFNDGIPVYRHRKMWEWCAIAQALFAHGKLREGNQGCGFAVGLEPLPSLFAACGADVLATDLIEHKSGWRKTGQQAHAIEELRWPNLISSDDFIKRVHFANVNMRDLSLLKDSRFDFLWSSCALEHIGSLEDGIKFIEKSTELLKPGGIAVHTTEFNVSSNDKNQETRGCVIYRRRDIADLRRRLRERSAELLNVSFETGNSEIDKNYDPPPYYESGRHHVTLLMGGFVTTSIILVIRRDP